MPKGYWIVRVDVKDEEPVKRYVAGNHPIFEKFGGRYLIRAQKFAVPEGSSRSLHVVIEFPDFRLRWRAITRLSIKPTRRLETGIWSPTSSLSRATMARSHGAKRHLNDFPGSLRGSESDGTARPQQRFRPTAPRRYPSMSDIGLRGCAADLGRRRFLSQRHRLDPARALDVLL